ncbi:AMP-binding protein [Qipengyuania sp. MTN3-11]|uniref:AMP-binding protein n=1 Tax=Qipengyuania sp. MTN3-11 TaxID=3056557 RepID=UPI0036F429BF
MSIIPGSSQPYALTLDKFIDHAAKWHPGKGVVTASEDGQNTYLPYDTLRDRARAISTRLRHEGAKTGECVATLAWNTQAHMECWYAIMGIGAVCHTLNPRLPVETLADMVAQSQARILIASADQEQLAAGIAARCPSLDTIFVIDGKAEWSTPQPGVRILSLDVDADVAPAEWGGFDENAPCGLCFTSGTTGAPKGVTYTHRGIFLHTLRQLQADVAGIVEADVVLPAVPMFHANGWGLPFACPAVGASLVLPGRRTDGASLAALIARHGVTIAVGVPTVWLDLFDHAEREGIELPSLKRLMVGGASMPEALSRRILARGIEVQQTWGMTELSPLGTAIRPGTGHGASRASGTPALGLDLLLMDHEGVPISEQRGKEGRLHVRGPSVVECYFGERTPATADGWFDTGDLAVIDGSGSVEITGRSKDLIKSGGEWVNPVELETVVGSLDGIRKVAVIPRSHPKWGERPVLIVELADGASMSDAELLDPLRSRFAKWWLPDDIIRVASMPLATTGKIDKRQLRSEYGTQ